jgi:hypothetical protein
MLTLGWWNTSLSPPKGREVSEKDQNFALKIVGDLLGEGVDVLGLCEVSIDDVKKIESELGSLGYGVIYALDPAGLSKFDLALVYRLSKVTCVGGSPWTSAFGKTTFRTGYPIEVTTLDGEKIYVVMCHWPGRRFYPAQNKNRNRIAIDMRSKLLELMSNGVKDIVIMGDFNDEPFDQNIAHVLHALRDRSSAALGNDLFYNPFWNCLGSSPLLDGDSEISRSGTHYYRVDHTECWWTFDQIIFSSSFLGTGRWLLDEVETKLYEPIHLLARLKKKGKFDHLPVISRICKRP